MAKGVIFLAAGGTGGHLFPAEALAHELTARGWDVHLVTDHRVERFIGQFPAAAIHQVRSATMGSKHPVALAKPFWTIWGGVRESYALLARPKPTPSSGSVAIPRCPRYMPRRGATCRH